MGVSSPCLLGLPLLLALQAQLSGEERWKAVSQAADTTVHMLPHSRSVQDVSCRWLTWKSQDNRGCTLWLQALPTLSTPGELHTLPASGPKECTLTAAPACPRAGGGPGRTPHHGTCEVSSGQQPGLSQEPALQTESKQSVGSRPGLYQLPQSDRPPSLPPGCQVLD